MPDFNKGDFTQQGVAGHVNANLRLNEKRLVNIDLTSNEEAEGCTIAGTVKDLLNNEVYGIGAGVSGNIEITENGENINVAPYATATVNVSGGGGDGTYEIRQVNVENNTEVDAYILYPTYATVDGDNVFAIKQSTPMPGQSSSLAGCVTTNNKIYLYIQLDDGSDTFTVTVSQAASYSVSDIGAYEMFTKKVLITFDGDSIPRVSIGRGE